MTSLQTVSLYNNLGAGNAKRPTVGSSATKSRMASFFGRLNYTFKRPLSADSDIACRWFFKFCFG